MKKILASLVVGFCFTLLLGESGSANTVQMFLPEYIFSFDEKNNGDVAVVDLDKEDFRIKSFIGDFFGLF